MPSTDVTTVLDREFLRIRGTLLDLAAALDRIDRDPHANLDDARRDQFRQALQKLMADGIDRAQAIQHIFSIPYQSDWRTTYEI